MKLVPITVQSYSGYKAEEYPKSFSLEGDEYIISAITDRWYQGDNNPDFPASDYFRVQTEPEESYLLKHEIGSDRWYIVESLD